VLADGHHAISASLWTPDGFKVYRGDDYCFEMMLAEPKDHSHCTLRLSADIEPAHARDLVLVIEPTGAVAATAKVSTHAFDPFE